MTWAGAMEWIEIELQPESVWVIQVRDQHQQAQASRWVQG